MTRRARILGGVVVVIVACVVYLWFFGIATSFALEARYIGWKTPVVKAAPVELTDLSASQSPGHRLSYFGYEFEVPWSDLDEEKTKLIGKMQLIVFRSDRTILFSAAQPGEFVDRVLGGPNAQTLRSLYGEDVSKSDYSFLRAILEATPSQVGLFSSRTDAVRTSMLLVCKGVMMPRGAESGIYFVRAGNFQGFQYGDPAARPRSITVEMFAENGGVSLIFGQRDNGPSQAITQADINHVLQSVRRSAD